MFILWFSICFLFGITASFMRTRFWKKKIQKQKVEYQKLIEEAKEGIRIARERRGAYRIRPWKRDKQKGKQVVDLKKWKGEDEHLE